MSGKSELITHGRRFNDIALAFVESVYEAGGGDDDARRIFGDQLLKRRLGLLVMGKIKLGLFPSETYAADLIPKGGGVIEDVEPSEFSVADLEFVPFLDRDDQSGTGEEMRKCAFKLLANFGLVDGKRILDFQEEIPEDLRDKYIPLPGTVLLGPNGKLRIAYLVCVVGRWFLVFDDMDGDWHGGGRLARHK